MEVALIIIGIIIVLILLSILGWGAKLFGFLFDLFVEGIGNFAGCLWTIVVIVFFILTAIAIFS